MYSNTVIILIIPKNVSADHEYRFLMWSNCSNIAFNWLDFTLPLYIVPVIQCGPPPSALPHGSSTHTGTRFSDKVSYSCEKGYRLEGNKDIFCEATGQWGAAPTCECKSPWIIITERLWITYEICFRQALFKL